MHSPGENAALRGKASLSRVSDSKEGPANVGRGNLLLCVNQGCGSEVEVAPSDL